MTDLPNKHLPVITGVNLGSVTPPVSLCQVQVTERKGDHSNIKKFVFYFSPGKQNLTEVRKKLLSQSDDTALTETSVQYHASEEKLGVN